MIHQGIGFCLSWWRAALLWCGFLPFWPLVQWWFQASDTPYVRTLCKLCFSLQPEDTFTSPLSCSRSRSAPDFSCSKKWWNFSVMSLRCRFLSAECFPWDEKPQIWFIYCHSSCWGTWTLVGFMSVLGVHLARSVLRCFLAALRFVSKGSPPALVQAGLLIIPHTSAWVASPCMTHVAIKNVHFNLLFWRWDYLM